MASDAARAERTYAARLAALAEQCKQAQQAYEIAVEAVNAADLELDMFLGYGPMPETWSGAVILVSDKTEDVDDVQGQ